MKQIISLAGLALLTGCITYSLEELRRVEPQGNAFQTALFHHYKNFAEKEEQDYDWADAMYFADKGLQAAYGNAIPPEDPTQWNIDAETLPLLQTGYQTLTELLEGGIAEKQPEVAARAQYFFDCWVEQQEEGWQVDDIAYCRDGFKDAMDLLLGGEKEESAVVVPEEASELSPTAFTAPPKPQVDSYIVFFREKEAEMSASGLDTIEEVIEKIQDGGTYQFILNSHTDTVGEEQANLKLSEERAQKVRQLLIAGGVDGHAIRHFAFGESDTPVRTADNIDEPANQRVEIFLSE
ncbi:MAG: OmpA family protein [Alphaproteobacteria bacterium]